MYKTSLDFSISCFRSRVLVWLLLAVILCSFIPSVSLAQQPTAIISTLSGIVLVNGQEQGKDTVLSAGDVIETQAGASVVLELSDGSLLELGENTKIDIAELSQTATGARISRMKMWWGQIRARLSLGHQQAGSVFDIETPNALVGAKFSQPDIEVSYDQAKQETVALARTVALLARNLLTKEEIIVPVGSTVIITTTTIKIIAGIISIEKASVEAAKAEAMGAETAAGMSTATKVAIGAGAVAAAGGVAAVAASSGGGDDSNGGDSTTTKDLSGEWIFSGSGSAQGCPAGDYCYTKMFPAIEGFAVSNGPFSFSNVSLNVTQAGNALSGFWEWITEVSATLDGVVSDSSVSFTIQGVDNVDHRGTVTTTYTGAIDGNTIRGDFSGSGTWIRYSSGHPDYATGNFSWAGNFTVTIRK